MTNEHCELCKAIIKETLDVIKDTSMPLDFREELKAELLELKDEIERAIICYA
jgi:hypothetical protein